MSHQEVEPSATPVEHLMRAVRDLASGRITLTDQREELGQMVLHEGRIAWATCRGQSETLGVFLWRLGRISREQLAHVQGLYQEHKGSRKLASLLEESGFMSRPVLRRCLLLHARSAIGRLLSFPNAQASWVPGSPAADEAFLFDPEEVLPEGLSLDIVEEWSVPETTRVRGWRQRTSENAVLEPFYSLPDHLASAVITAEGEIIAAHVASDSLDLHRVAVVVTSMLESSSRLANVSSLSSVGLITLECSQGTLYVRWLDERHTRLVLVQVGKLGNAYLTRYSINLTAPLIDEWITRGGGTIRRLGNVLRKQDDGTSDVKMLIAEARRATLSDLFPAIPKPDSSSDS